MITNEKPQPDLLRLFDRLIALVVSAQPFADVVRNYASCDRDQEPQQILHDYLLSMSQE